MKKKRRKEKVKKKKKQEKKKEKIKGDCSSNIKREGDDVRFC